MEHYSVKLAFRWGALINSMFILYFDTTMYFSSQIGYICCSECYIWLDDKRIEVIGTGASPTFPVEQSYPF